jgi:ATP-dependent RNA helicase DeaD
VRAERAERAEREEPRPRGEGEERRPRREPEPREVTLSAAAEGERAPAPGAPPEAAPADGGQRPARAKLFVSLGEQDGAGEDKVREALAALAPGVEVRAVDVRRSHSFVEVAPDAVDAAVQALHGKDWNGKALTAERARRRRR